MKIWAIIPVKPFNRAKSRLAKILAPEERAEFAERLFKHTVEVATKVKEISGVLVISRDTKVLAMARDYGAHTVQESGVPDLNPALLRASQVVGAQGATGVLVVPADLPLLAEEDLREMVHLGRYNATVVVAPDRNEDGTNALLVNPPGYIPFSFGIGSFQKHIQQAEEVGATVKIYRSERIGLDIDLPEDLDNYYKLINVTRPTREIESVEHPEGPLPLTE